MKQLFALTLALAGAATLTMAYHAPVPAISNQSTDADQDAVRKTAKEFEAAFNQGNAGAIAAQCTDRCELREAGGELIVGKEAIEKAYAEFFKNNKGTTIEVLVKSVRFPAKDLAIEEGVLRQSNGPASLPRTTSYVSTHIREGGQWKLAISDETGAGKVRLEDLDWLLGEWTTKVKGDAVKITFARDPKKSAINATFSRTLEGGKTMTGGIHIALDPETGLFRSWGFDDDGGHFQSLWHHDGKCWVLDQQGVLGNGTPTAERIVLNRVGADAFTWRVIDRLMGLGMMPDTAPLRLTRTVAK